MNAKGAQKNPIIKPSDMSTKDSDDEKQIYQWLHDMCSEEKRVQAMYALCHRRTIVENLGFLLWHSFGCVSALIQEISQIFMPVMSETLTAIQSHRACASISLVQAIAANPETKVHLLRSEVMMYLIPLLKNTSQARPIEYLRISILGVVGAVLKQGADETVTFILTSEVVPIVLRIIETGSEMCKAVSAYILHRIIEHEIGLEYVCSKPDRFTHVMFTLGKVVVQLTLEPSIRILKQIVRCYERLADHPRARDVLRDHLPEQLRDATFYDCLQQDKSTRDSLMELIKKVGFGTLSNK